MSISDIKRENRNRILDAKKKKAEILYAAAAAFCFLFQLIYEHFSHGVTSYYMVCAFLIPLAGLAMTELLFHLYKNRLFDRAPASFDLSLQFLSGAVIWLTLGSMFEGVLEIYGTTNHLIVVFPVAGLLQIAASAAALFKTLPARPQ